MGTLSLTLIVKHIIIKSLLEGYVYAEERTEQQVMAHKKGS